MLSEEYVSLLSEEFARDNHVISMKKTDTGILVAMEDPEDLDAIDGIRKISGLNPEIVIAGRSAIKNAINKLYGTIKQSDEISTENIWQIHKKYIISEINSGLVIIDQHVAHERILYEEALKAFESTSMSSQTVLFPESISFSLNHIDRYQFYSLNN